MRLCVFTYSPLESAWGNGQWVHPSLFHCPDTSSLQTVTCTKGAPIHPRETLLPTA